MLDGYYNRSDLTAKVLKDGWYWSGDLGFLLDSELYVVGRKKDLIIIAGKNIYPQDVEEIVLSHPSIHPGRAVAFGIYNEELGTEDLIAVAEVNDETFLADALRIESAIKNAIIGELGITVRTVYLKPPKWIIKSTAGKPARSSTREKLMSEHPELQRT
jgi:acyl-CoA synthetase (AMP-forming)/AMP-acid ligase II